jgi:hypothetical protein
MSPTAATMGSAKRSKKRKPTATPPELEETVYDTTATMESGEESEEAVHDTTADVESGEEIQQPELQEEAGDNEPVEAADQETGVSYRAVSNSFFKTSFFCEKLTTTIITG